MYIFAEKTKFTYHFKYLNSINLWILFFRLYKSFLLWLEEPKLQNSELFAPALSATFNAAKLIEIINGDEVV